MSNTNSNEQPPPLVAQVDPVQGGVCLSLITGKLQVQVIIEERSITPLCNLLLEAAKKIPKIVLPG